MFFWFSHIEEMTLRFDLLLWPSAGGGDDAQVRLAALAGPFAGGGDDA